jgi:hypothetical protein
MDLRKIISYNNYEGFRCFGVLQMTGFKKFQIEGYSAYGTKTGILNII